MLGRMVVPHPVTVMVAGHTVMIPPAPASVWLVALSSDTPVQSVLPGMLDGEDYGMLAASLLVGECSSDELETAFYEVLTDVAGRPWWEATRLIGNASSPEIYGRLILAGVDPEQVTLAGFCAAMYALIVKHMDDKARNRFDFDLKLPPANAAVQGDSWDAVEW